MEEVNRRIVSSDRLDLIKAYELEPTFKGRALAADALWMSLVPGARHAASRNGGHHCGNWLQDVLGPSDAKLGLAPLSATSRYNLKILLLKEKGIRGRPGRNTNTVWSWLDNGAVTPQQLKRLLEHAEHLMETPGAEWESSLLSAKDLVTKSRYEKAVEEPSTLKEPVKSTKRAEAKKEKATPPQRIAVEKTLQFQQLKKVIDDAPPPKELPIPEGVDAATYREAYSEMLENIRVVLEMSGRDFFNAKRRHRTTEITMKVGALSKSCRTLRVAVPAPGQPVDYFNSRRRWLEIMKSYHPDKIPPGTPQAEIDSKVAIFDAANKAFEIIKEYNRKLEGKAQEAK